MTRLATVPTAVRAIQPPVASGNGLARIDSQARRALCSNPACRKVITRLVLIGKGGILRPVFNGEWHEGDDHVWRVTDYAKAARSRADEGAPRLTRRALGLFGKRMWSDPTTWPPVVANSPCQVECQACGERLTIRLG